MKFLLTILLSINVFAFDVIQITFNKSLTNTIYETVDLVYSITDDMRRSSYYYENNDYEVVVMLDSRDAEISNYTVIFIRPVDSKLSDDNLITLRINRDGRIYLVGEMLLTKEDIILKQDYINKLINECKLDMLIKRNKKDSRETYIKNKFMDNK